jgi:hypothetical protein
LININRKYIYIYKEVLLRENDKRRRGEEGKGTKRRRKK